MTITIFGLPNTPAAFNPEWFAVPRDKAEEYLANHHNYKQCRDAEIYTKEVVPIGTTNTTASKLLLYKDSDEKFAFARTNLVYASEQRHLQFDATDRYPKLNEAASRLIFNLRDSDSGESELSYDELVKIQSYTERDLKEVALIGHAPYQKPTLTHYRVLLNDGTERDIYSTSVGYSEGYHFDLFTTLKSAQRSFFDNYGVKHRHDWLDLECNECGAVYDEPRHVEPGQMSCDRCD